MCSVDRDWDRHFQDIFQSALRATEQLREENTALRVELSSLQANRQAEQRQAELEQTLGVVTAERDALRRELEEIRQAMEQARSENREFADQFVTLERQNSNFISLYVASSQLHATLDHTQVLQSLREIVINLIGAERFGVYLWEAGAREFRLAAGEEMTEAERQPVPWEGTLFGEIAASQQLYLAPPATTPLDGSQPIAIQPLVIYGELVGLLVIYRLLTQKDGFEPVDLELFELLAAHAAAALMSSLLYLRSERKAATLKGLLTLFQTDAGSAPGA